MVKQLFKKHPIVPSATVDTILADVLSFSLDVDKKKWHSPKNSGPPRTQSAEKDAEIRRQVDKLLKLGVIRPSKATHYSHPHLTPKPDGSWRFCIDYRALNNCSASSGWPIPNIDHLLRRVGNKRATTFATFDLTSGYHQTALSQDSVEYTAFMCSNGVYEWVRLPFGLKGAPSYFMQKMSTEVLQGLLYNIVECYIDDVIIWGTNSDELLINIETLLKMLSEKNIKINPKKAKIGLPEIEYTGHVLSEEGLNFSAKKIEKVVNLKLPTTQKELRSFLGLTNYFRQHIQNYSAMVQPSLNAVRVYKPRQNIKWDALTRHAFELTKTAINECPQLFFLHDDLPIYLHTDASDYGIGAYLYQKKGNQEHPIAFLSRTFTGEQKRWSVPDKECYAIIYAFKKLEHYIRDRFFILRTDHKNLTYIDLENSGKVRRWKILMQQYNFDIELFKSTP